MFRSRSNGLPLWVMCIRAIWALKGEKPSRVRGGLPAHNLYVCPRNSLGLENHLAVRDYLRTHADAARSYGDLKKRLAGQFRHDIDGYVAGKTDAILEILRDSGFPVGKLHAIERANRKSD